MRGPCRIRSVGSALAVVLAGGQLAGTTGVAVDEVAKDVFARLAPEFVLETAQGFANDERAIRLRQPGPSQDRRDAVGLRSLVLVEADSNHPIATQRGTPHESSSRARANPGIRRRAKQWYDTPITFCKQYRYINPLGEGEHGIGY